MQNYTKFILNFIHFKVFFLLLFIFKILFRKKVFYLLQVLTQVCVTLNNS